jgi:hypothetical protein
MTLILKEDGAVFVHTLCENNTCEDFLVKFDARNLEIYSPIVIVYVEMNLFILADVSRTLYSRSFFF